MSRSLSQIHGGSTGIALGIGGLVAVLLGRLWTLTSDETTAVIVGTGALVRWIEWMLGPIVQKRRIRAELARRREERKP